MYRVSRTQFLACILIERNNGRDALRHPRCVVISPRVTREDHIRIGWVIQCEPYARDDCMLNFTDSIWHIQDLLSSSFDDLN